MAAQRCCLQPTYFCLATINCHGLSLSWMLITAHASSSGAEKSHSGHQRGLEADDQPRAGAPESQQASPSGTSDGTARVLGAWGSGSSPSIRRQSADPPTGQHCHRRLGHPQASSSAPPPAPTVPQGPFCGPSPRALSLSTC